MSAKTIEEVYEDRNAAVVALAEMVHRYHEAAVEAGLEANPMDYRAMWDEPNEDDADAEEWAIVYVWLPTGQASWHVPRELVDASTIPSKTAAWDGHDREEKNRRLRQFAAGHAPE